MTTEVASRGQVLINDKRYKLKGKVRSSVASQLVAKQIFGDFTKDSHRETSIRAMSKWTGGIGTERQTGRDDQGVAWHSGADLRQEHHLRLPPLATKTASPTNTGIPLIGELDGAIVAAFGTKIESLNFGGDNWTVQFASGTNDGPLAATPTDVINVNMNDAGTFREYLIFAHTANYSFAHDVTDFNPANGAKPVVKMAFHRLQLWGIDATGLLWRTYTVGNGGEVDNARLPLSSGDTVTGLFTGPFNGKEILYATTQRAVWRHDFGNREWIDTGISLPHNIAASGVARQATLWRGIPTVAASTGFKRFTASETENVEQPVLLGDPGGLKKTKEGRVFCMADSIADLIIGTTPVNSTDTAAIFQWHDKMGLQMLWEALATNKKIDSLHVTSATGSYLLFFAYDNEVYWIRLHDTTGNPGQVNGWTYTTSRIIIHETPWADEDTEDRKVLLQTMVEAQDVDTDPPGNLIYVQVYVGYDYSETFTLLRDAQSSDSTFDAGNDAIQGAGITTFTFPTEAAPTGTEYRAIRWRFDLYTDTSTITPDVVSIWYRFLIQPDNKDAFTFELDMTKKYLGRTPKQQRSDFKTATESKTLVPFTYRDDSGGTRDFWVDVAFADSDEESGHNEAGLTAVRCGEPS